LTVCRGQKLGLVGVNGCGKSTMLKVMGGREDADSGTTSSPKNTRVVYVDQVCTYLCVYVRLSVVRLAKLFVAAARDTHMWRFVSHFTPLHVARAMC
jgi:ABC-type Mn2+/Zn2+ transport system ATPase subunit